MKTWPYWSIPLRRRRPFHHLLWDMWMEMPTWPSRHLKLNRYLDLESRNEPINSVVETLVFCTGCNHSHQSAPPGHLIIATWGFAHQRAPTKVSGFFGWCPNFSRNIPPAISGNLRLRKSQFLNSKSTKILHQLGQQKSDDLIWFKSLLAFLDVSFLLIFFPILPFSHFHACHEIHRPWRFNGHRGYQIATRLHVVFLLKNWCCSLTGWVASAYLKNSWNHHLGIDSTPSWFWLPKSNNLRGLEIVCRWKRMGSISDYMSLSSSFVLDTRRNGSSWPSSNETWEQCMTEGRYPAWRSYLYKFKYTYTYPRVFCRLGAIHRKTNRSEKNWCSITDLVVFPENAGRMPWNLLPSQHIFSIYSQQSLAAVALALAMDWIKMPNIFKRWNDCLNHPSHTIFCTNFRESSTHCEPLCIILDCGYQRLPPYPLHRKPVPWRDEGEAKYTPEN